MKLVRWINNLSAMFKLTIELAGVKINDYTYGIYII